MSSRIANEARKHLTAFLGKLEDGSYTPVEYENFTIMGYLTPELEKIRIEICSMISLATKDCETGIPIFDDEKKVFLRDLIDLLERGQN